jgi:hypothetical protein
LQGYAQATFHTHDKGAIAAGLKGIPNLLPPGVKVLYLNGFSAKRYLDNPLKQGFDCHVVDG